jgi:hypothetical protein
VGWREALRKRAVERGKKRNREKWKVGNGRMRRVNQNKQIEGDRKCRKPPLKYYRSSSCKCAVNRCWICEYSMPSRWEGCTGCSPIFASSMDEDPVQHNPSQ